MLLLMFYRSVLSFFMFIVAFGIYYQDILDKGLLLTRKLAFDPSGKVEVVLRSPT
jgi:hypothetical protein